MSPGGRDRLPEGPGTGGIDRVTRLRDLGEISAIAIGTRVFVVEDEHIYIGVGNSTAEIASRLGWSQQNVWLPEHVHQNLLWRHPEIKKPIDCMASILRDPETVNAEPGQPAYFRFLVDAVTVRTAGFVTSRTMKRVDVIVEFRQVDGGSLLRAFHLAPTRHPARGLRLWP